jgi:hypothetical protein
MTDHNDSRPGDFECVETELGDLLWRLADSDLDADLKKRLEDHLFICSACRLDLMVEERVIGGLRRAELQLGETEAVVREESRSDGRQGHASRAGRLAAIGGGLAMAASLVLMVNVPPNSRISDDLQRGQGSGAGILRPVEGEKVAGDRPEFRWLPISGATSYRVEVSEVDGPWAWTGQTELTALTLPADVALPNDGHYRALIEPVPADLSGLIAESVYFQRTGRSEFLLYRVGAAPGWVRGLAWLSLAILGGAVLSRVPVRRKAV